MYSPIRRGRLKTRVRSQEKVDLYVKALKSAENEVLPDFKQFINALPLWDRIRAAALIIVGRL